MRRIAVAVCVLVLAVLILLPKLHEVYAQLATAPWPMFNHDSAHTGLSQFNTSANDGNLKWKSSTLNVDSSAAIGADGTIYIDCGAVSSVSSVCAVNPDGTLKWTFPTAGPPSNLSDPAIGADGTIFSLAATEFYAINPNGTQKWAFEI